MAPVPLSAKPLVAVAVSPIVSLRAPNARLPEETITFAESGIWLSTPPERYNTVPPFIVRSSAECVDRSGFSKSQSSRRNSCEVGIGIRAGTGEVQLTIAKLCQTAVTDYATEGRIVRRIVVGDLPRSTAKIDGCAE